MVVPRCTQIYRVFWLQRLEIIILIVNLATTPTLPVLSPSFSSTLALESAEGRQSYLMPLEHIILMPIHTVPAF